jgi:hypothetical protein
MLDIVGELRALTQDIGSLRDAYRESERPDLVLKMTAAKCDHVASVFREIAEAIEPDIATGDSAPS